MVGWAKFLYTPNGKNHGYYLWEFAKKQDNWFTMLRTIDQTRKSNGDRVITQHQIDQLRAQGKDEEFIQQEYYCSFRMGTAGAYYAKLMEEARSEHRIRSVMYDRSLPVHTAWDIGVDDFTSIIFFQQTGNEYHIIDFYEGMGEGVDFYVMYCGRSVELENSTMEIITYHTMQKQSNLLLVVNLLYR